MNYFLSRFRESENKTKTRRNIFLIKNERSAKLKGGDKDFYLSRGV
jgi:hypothetical protein